MEYVRRFPLSPLTMVIKRRIDIFVMIYVVIGTKSRFHLRAVTFLGPARSFDVRFVDLHFNVIIPLHVLLKAAT